MLHWYICIETLVTSIETSIAAVGTLDFSMQLMKSVVSLRYDPFCCCALG